MLSRYSAAKIVPAIISQVSAAYTAGGSATLFGSSVVASSLNRGGAGAASAQLASVASSARPHIPAGVASTVGGWRCRVQMHRAPITGAAATSAVSASPGSIRAPFGLGAAGASIISVEASVTHIVDAAASSSTRSAAAIGSIAEYAASMPAGLVVETAASAAFHRSVSGIEAKVVASSAAAKSTRRTLASVTDTIISVFLTAGRGRAVQSVSDATIAPSVSASVKRGATAVGKSADAVRSAASKALAPIAAAAQSAAAFARGGIVFVSHTATGLAAAIVSTSAIAKPSRSAHAGVASHSGSGYVSLGVLQRISSAISAMFSRAGVSGSISKSIAATGHGTSAVLVSSGLVAPPNIVADTVVFGADADTISFEEE